MCLDEYFRCGHSVPSKKGSTECNTVEELRLNDVRECPRYIVIVQPTRCRTCDIPTPEDDTLSQGNARAVAKDMASRYRYVADQKLRARCALGVKHKGELGEAWRKVENWLAVKEARGWAVCIPLERAPSITSGASPVASEDEGSTYGSSSVSLPGTGTSATQTGPPASQPTSAPVRPHTSHAEDESSSSTSSHSYHSFPPFQSSPSLSDDASFVSVSSCISDNDGGPLSPQSSADAALEAELDDAIAALDRFRERNIAMAALDRGESIGRWARLAQIIGIGKRTGVGKSKKVG